LSVTKDRNVDPRIGRKVEIKNENKSEVVTKIWYRQHYEMFYVSIEGDHKDQIEAPEDLVFIDDITDLDGQPIRFGTRVNVPNDDKIVSGIIGFSDPNSISYGAWQMDQKRVFVNIDNIGGVWFNINDVKAKM
jgi:hypothetical protein